ncbi:hypothetical protein ACFXC2_14780, partial [Streptomyces lavendulae]
FGALAELREAGLIRNLGVSNVTPEQLAEARSVGHPRALPTVVDEALTGHARIWAAAGTPHTVFPTTADELLRLTGGRLLPVGPGTGTEPA